MWCDDMRLGHYYPMLQSGPWGVSSQYWAACLLTKSCSRSQTVDFLVHIAILGGTLFDVKKFCVCKYPGWKRRTCQLEGFYGEQYLSDSDTCATTAPPPQKLNLLDLNCKFSGRYLHQKNWKYCPPIRSANIYWWSSLLQQHLPTVPLLYISPICHHLLPVALLLLYIQSFSTLRQNWNGSQC